LELLQREIDRLSEKLDNLEEKSENIMRAIKAVGEIYPSANNF
jgi:hypothetical protein